MDFESVPDESKALQTLDEASFPQRATGAKRSQMGPSAACRTESAAALLCVSVRSRAPNAITAPWVRLRPSEGVVVARALSGLVAVGHKCRLDMGELRSL